MLDLASGTG